MRTDYSLGDLGFDPLDLKPTDPEELKTMQTKELNSACASPPYLPPYLCALDPLSA